MSYSPTKACAANKARPVFYTCCEVPHSQPLFSPYEYIETKQVSKAITPHISTCTCNSNHWTNCPKGSTATTTVQVNRSYGKSADWCGIISHNDCIPNKRSISRLSEGVFGSFISYLEAKILQFKIMYPHNDATPEKNCHVSKQECIMIFCQFCNSSFTRELTRMRMHYQQQELKKIKEAD